MPGMASRSRSPSVSPAFAVLGAELPDTGVPVDVRLIPAGEFRAVDGRPHECGAWVMTDEDGARLVAEAAARSSDYLIDYDHQTLHAKANGQPAPASGWFKRLEWRPGDGLWMVGVNWTALAAERIAGREYRYISPVFSYDQKSGRVLALLHAALTNNPGLDGLADLAALAAELFTRPPSAKESGMNELCEQCCYLLNLPVGTPPEEIVAHLQKIIDQLKGAGAGTGAAAMSVDLPAHLAALTAQVAAPDPARFAPVAALTALQGENAQLKGSLAALTAEVDGAKLDKTIADGLAAGKLTPATEAWARDLGKSNLAALTSFIAAAPAVVALGATQTGGAKPAGSAPDGEDASSIAQAALKYQTEQGKVGINVSTVDAVAFVTKKGA